MGVNVGNMTATLNVDFSQYQKDISAASEKYREFIDNCERTVGFGGATKDLQALTNMIKELAELEDWSTEQRIAGLERVSGLYENNMRQQMKLELEIHKLRQQQEKEREEALQKAQKEAYESELMRIDRLDTGYDKTTDFAAMIAEYEGLKELAEDNAKWMATLEDRIADAAEQRKNKITNIKKEEIDEQIAENERLFKSNKMLYEDDLSYSVEYYNKQLDLNRQMIDELLSQGEALTKEQDKELKNRLDNEADYYAEIVRLTNEAELKRQEEAAKRQKAEQEAALAIIEAIEKEQQAHAKAMESRNQANAKYYESVSKERERAHESELKLLQDYERAVKSVNDRLIADEARIYEAYEKSLVSKQNSLMNFTGLFDSVKEKDVTGEQLLSNLQGQVDAMRLFEDSLKSLQSKGIGEDLLKQLQELGYGRAAEVAALDTLNQEELQAYKALYNEKVRIAYGQAYEQMADQRKQVDEDIQRLRGEASTQINQLTADYNENMFALSESTGKALSALADDWQKTLSSIDDTLNKEVESQQKTIAQHSAVIQGMNKTEATLFSKLWQDRTSNVRTESRKQEQEVRISQTNNANILKEFLPVWQQIGQQYGELLLSGIQSTRGDIQRYLTSLANAAQSAKSGMNASVPDTGYAEGTNNAARGLAFVGEEGPEIVDFSGGEQVMTFNESIQLLKDGISALSYGVRATEYYESVVSPTAATIDYDKLAKTIIQAMPKQTSIVYNPVYNSPRPASVAELKQQDKINMRRLGLSL